MSLELKIGASWVPVLEDEFRQEYLLKLGTWLAYQRTNGLRPIYPDSDDVFRALKECPHGQVKVVIVGKSPYYQPGVADGLAFSYKGGMRHLQNLQALDVILDEIERDCYNGFNVNRDYDLTYLAKQGVLLLNSVLSVFKGDADSHSDIGWQRFVAKIIATQIIEPSPKVFMLWGTEAKDVFSMADKQTDVAYVTKHHVLTAFHPAYDLRTRDTLGQITANYPYGFTGCSHFRKANEFLINNHLEPIEWFNMKEPFLNPSLKKEEVLNEQGYPETWNK